MTGVCLPLKMMFLLLLIAIPLACGDRIVKTNSGLVKGISLAHMKVEAFLGLPYAEPPVGPLRFARPVPKSPWKETYDASKPPPACVQFVMKGLEVMLNSDRKIQEDCLYLNLWVPEGGSTLKPIMLFIHGGGFMMGSSNMKIYDGAKLSERGDVIVASMNYRVGSLGFFTGFGSKMMFMLLLIAIPLAYGDRNVKTNSGPVKGVSLAPMKVEAFLGIPYAEPPVGPLRFARPVPKSPWKETYDANRLPPTCVQFVIKELEVMLNTDYKMQEDCLYLNLWVPEGGSDLKPIMLFIHGGSFMTGSSNMKIYDGAKLSERGDVIVASINYRLGSLGFFLGFIDEAAGSMGMYDQVMAIKWIKDNAKHFGGDPENIVLFGESAGAYSVSMHSVSPLSKHLFKRGILQSGSAVHPMFNNEVLFKGSQTIASMLGCAEDIEALKKNPKSVVECMKNLPAEKFSEVDQLYNQKYGFLFPRFGDEFLPESPAELARKGESKETEVLLGVTRDEGSMMLTVLKPDVFGMFGEKMLSGDINETLAKEVFQFIKKVDGDNKIFQGYIDRVKSESRYTYLNALTDAAGDYLITCGAVFEADYNSLKNNPVYFYLFDYRSPSSPVADWMGVVHAEELPYVFGNPLFYQLNDYEKELSKDVMDMWVAFAKTGNPNIPGGLEWPRYTYEDPKYFTISRKDRIGIRPDNYRCEAWRKFFGFGVDADD